jgi:molybdopterin converting factor small subunit
MTDKVTIRYFAAARDAAGVDVDVMVIGDAGPVTVAHLRALVAAHRPRVAVVLRQSRFAVNERFVSDDAVVIGGADVAVIPPVGGG